MHPVKIRSKISITILALVLALGLGMPSPAQAYLLDFTVASINPGVLISYAGGYPPGPPLVESNPKVSDLSLMRDQGPQLSPTSTLYNRILNFQTGSSVHYFSNASSATSVWMFGGTSPQGSITLQGGIPALNMFDGTTLWGSFGTASVMESAPVSGHSFIYPADSNFTDHNNDGLSAYPGIHHQADNSNLDPGFAASFASGSGAFVGTRGPSGNILNRIAPFSSTLLLLGGGLMGLVGLRSRRR
jgi:hypothetical protein